MAFNHKRADFLASKIWIFFSLFSHLKAVFFKKKFQQSLTKHHPQTFVLSFQFHDAFTALI